VGWGVGAKIVQPQGAPSWPPPPSPLRDKLADATGYPLPTPVLRQANPPCAISVPLRQVNHGQQRSTEPS